MFYYYIYVLFVEYEKNEILQRVIHRFWFFFIRGIYTLRSLFRKFIRTFLACRLLYYYKRSDQNYYFFFLVQDVRFFLQRQRGCYEEKIRPRNFTC